MLETRLEGSEERMLMKTGEEGGMALREMPWPILGVLRFMMGEGCWMVNCGGGFGSGGAGEGGRSQVSVEGRGVLWASEGA